MSIAIPKMKDTGKIQGSWDDQSLNQRIEDPIGGIQGARNEGKKVENDGGAEVTPGYASVDRNPGRRRRRKM